MYSTFGEDLVGWEVVHFVDNTSAVYGLVKGYSPQPDSAAIIAAFHVSNVALRALVWFNYVASKANVADLPSRGAFDEMAFCLSLVQPSFNLDGSFVATVLPPIERDWPVLVSTILGALRAPSSHSRRGARKRARGAPVPQSSG